MWRTWPALVPSAQTTEPDMTDFRPSAFLRNVLLADAATCVAAGLLMLLGAGFLDTLLGLPVPLLRYAGASLLPFAALLAFVATRDNPGRAAIWAIIVANVVWVIGSFELLFTGWIAPTVLGTLFVTAQALTVAVLAALEYVGLRQSVARTS
jgi:hypothetical protein